MQIKIKTNTEQVTMRLTDIQKKQIPFATMKAINNTLFGLRKEMGKQTVKKLDRPTPFTQKGFLVTKANKRNLTGILYIRAEVEEYLKYVIDGGVRSGAKMIPIPFTANARLNRYGNIIGKRSGLIKKTQQFIATIKGVTGVWERYNKGKSVKLIIGFEPKVMYEKGKFPFYKIGRGYINNTYNKVLAKELQKALSTAK